MLPHVQEQPTPTRRTTTTPQPPKNHSTTTAPMGEHHTADATAAHAAAASCKNTFRAAYTSGVAAADGSDFFGALMLAGTLTDSARREQSFFFTGTLADSGRRASAGYRSAPEGRRPLRLGAAWRQRFFWGLDDVRGRFGQVRADFFFTGPIRAEGWRRDFEARQKVAGS